jgi:Ca2+-binding EF-hand superfamily protein
VLLNKTSFNQKVQEEFNKYDVDRYGRISNVEFYYCQNNIRSNNNMETFSMSQSNEINLEKEL